MYGNLRENIVDCNTFLFGVNRVRKNLWFNREVRLQFDYGFVSQFTLRNRQYY